MKNLIFLATLVIAGFAQAGQPHWDELVVDSTYSLAIEIPMAPNLVLPAEQELVLKQIDALDISVVLLTFKDLKCEDMTLKTDIILFNPEPQNTADDKSVGLKYDENCDINVFVETKNYYDVSIFR